MYGRRVGIALSVSRTSALLCVLGLLSSAATAQETARVSIDSSGGQGNVYSNQCSMSEDGRFVAFQSVATNLVPGDTNASWDIFVHDRLTATTTRVSVDSSGAEGNNSSKEPSISADGRVVAFWSVATNLVTGDTNGMYDVFIHDRQTGITERVSVDSLGAQASGQSYWPSISANGRFVAFESNASDLVPTDANGKIDVFVHDRQSGATTLASVDSSEVQGNDDSRYCSISGNGNRVAFYSEASNLVSGDTNTFQDVFLRDRQSGDNDSRERGLGGSPGKPGRPGSLDFRERWLRGVRELFHQPRAGRHQRRPGCLRARSPEREDDARERELVRSSGELGGFDPSISADGGLVAFESGATDLVAGDTNGRSDIFTHDRPSGTTARMSVDSLGGEGNHDSNDASISGDGRFVGFHSLANNLVANDTNNLQDVFVHGLSLTLEADLLKPFAGDSLTLTTRGGWPTGPVMLLVASWNGAPLNVRLGPVGIFDAGGVWAVGGPVPPGLGGNVAGFVSLGLVSSSETGLTNQVEIAFQ